MYTPDRIFDTAEGRLQVDSYAFKTRTADLPVALSYGGIKRLDLDMYVMRNINERLVEDYQHRERHANAS